LPFEKELIEYYNKLETAIAFEKLSEADKLQKKINKLRKAIYSNLNEWEITQVARHPDRPYTLDYINEIIEDFTEFHGDRAFADDKAIICGFGKFNGQVVCVIGHQKGRDTKQKIERNFGMPRPEGYRKALRIMKLANKFKRPVITFIDTPGAYPGLDAEERGQAEAIARNLKEMAMLEVPIVSVIIGEGGSGGALGIAVANRVLMLQYSIYSVISPEGCASILWKDATKAEEAAKALKFTAPHLKKFGIVDEIIPEPIGGAHTDPILQTKTVKNYIEKQIDRLSKLDSQQLVEDRYNKFRKLGEFLEA
jgi:acetyl-CoA carboxylase carboxyl transferase subunit alpha